MRWVVSNDFIEERVHNRRKRASNAPCCVLNMRRKSHTWNILTISVFLPSGVYGNGCLIMAVPIV